MDAVDQGTEDEAQPNRNLDVHVLCKTINKRYQPLEKYFERGVTLGEWESICKDAVSTFDHGDRILALQFRAMLKDMFPRVKTYAILVNPIPHESLRPKTACRATCYQGKARYEFTTYDKALRVCSTLQRNGYSVTPPEEISK
jgi:hypothetical protein